MSAFATELKRLRTQAGLSQRELAVRLDVRREIISQWEGAKFVPSDDPVAAVDGALDAGGALVRAARQDRGSAPRAPVPAAQPSLSGVDVATVFDRVARALRSRLLPDRDSPADDPRAGWVNDLRRESRPTPLSTALGLRALQLTDGHGDLDIRPALRLLADRQNADGGWSYRMHEIMNADGGVTIVPQGSRPEPTAGALDALARVGGAGADLDAGWRWLERGLSDRDRARPYVLSTVLTCAAELHPEPALLESLSTDLTRLARPDGMWSSNPTTPLVEASVAHTARAVVALRAASRHLGRSVEVRSAVSRGLAGIATWRREFAPVSELQRNDPDRRSHDVPVDHFTAAHALIALSDADVVVPPERLGSLWRTFWDAYDPDLGIWVWRHDGRTPLWMTLDAVRALRRWCMTSTSPPAAPLSGALPATDDHGDDVDHDPDAPTSVAE